MQHRLNETIITFEKSATHYKDAIEAMEKKKKMIYCSKAE